MPEQYDVIVVGGGPAGVSAARFAAEAGARTLLLEKYPQVMANKPCGEATSQDTFATAEIHRTPQMIMHEAYAQVYAPNLKYVEIKEVGYCLNKSLFIQAIAEKAAEAGAHIHVREEAEEVTRDGAAQMKLKTNRTTYEASVVVGADGYTSAVAKSLGIREKSEPIPTVQYVMANCKLTNPGAVRFYLGNDVAPLGYAWIFPKGEKVAEVGIGVRGVVAKAYLDRFVQKFSAELASAQIIDYRGAPVPIGGMISENVFDGTILIGDAAGTVIPLTGAGIHPSVAAGKIAGQVAAAAVAERDTSQQRLREFHRLYGEYWGKRIKKSLRAMRALEKLSDADFNALADVLDADDILDMANGLNVGRVAGKLLRHPVLAAKLARALL